MHSCAIFPFQSDVYTLSVCVIASTFNLLSVWVSWVTKENQSHFGKSVWVSGLLSIFPCLMSESRACTGASTIVYLWDESKPFGVFLFTSILFSVKLPSIVSIICLSAFKALVLLRYLQLVFRSGFFFFCFIWLIAFNIFVFNRDNVSSLASLIFYHFLEFLIIHMIIHNFVIKSILTSYPDMIQ